MTYEEKMKTAAKLGSQIRRAMESAIEAGMSREEATQAARAVSADFATPAPETAQ